VDDFYLHRSFSFYLNRQALENTKELKVRLFKIINKKMRGNICTSKKPGKEKRKWRMPGRKVGKENLQG